MRSLFFATASLLCSTLFARGDTIQVFNFQSDLTGGYTAQGLVNVDTTDGQIVSSDFTLSQGGVLDATFTTPDQTYQASDAYLAEFQDSTDGYTYELLLPNSTLISYTGGNVCTVTNTCEGYPSGVFLPGGSYAEAVDGTVNPTPEPASVIMLATGLAAGYVVSRRRWAYAPTKPSH